MSQEELILKKNLWSVMVKLSWPAVVAMVLYGLNAVLDAIFVGHFVGEVALAGVSVAYPLTQISMAVGSLIGVGAGSVLSIALGAKDFGTQKRLLGNVNVLTIVFTIVYMILGLVFSEQLVQVMGGKGEILVQGETYFRITVWGALFWIYGLTTNMIVRAEGKMKTAAIMMASGLIVNAIANYILMGVFNMGVEGAAWGTNIGMFVYSLVGWLYFSKGFATFKTKVTSIQWNRDITKSILGLGMSSLIMSIMSLVQAILVFNALSKYGTVVDIAFYGVVYRIFTFMLTPIFGLMRALQPVIGINYGAKQYDRVIKAYKIFVVAAMILTVPLWLGIMIFPDFVIGLMMDTGGFTSTQYFSFRLYMSTIPILSIIFMAMTFYPAIDNGKPAALIGIIRQVIFYIPAMIFLPKLIGIFGIYLGSFVIDTVITILTCIMVYKEFGKLRRDSGALALQE